MTADSNTPPVLISGAGPTGLMLACELARHGLRPRIIDKNAAAASQSRALGMQARTLEVCDSIGIARHVDRARA